MKRNETDVLAASKLGHLHQIRPHLEAGSELPADRLLLLFRCKLARVSKGIDRVHCFITPNRFDARKAERKATGVTSAWLDRVKSNLEDDIWFHFPIAAAVNNRVAFEMLG